MELSSDEQAHQQTMREYLLGAIAERGGWLDFASFMHAALYAPELGYYTNGLKKFGASGDFITAPEVSPLFGTLVGRQLCDYLSAHGWVDLVELGAGTGALAESVLRVFQDAGQPLRYHIVEVSPTLAARQQHRLVEFTGAQTVNWVRTMPLGPIQGCIVANEVADALPVARFRLRADGDIEAVGVAAVEGQLQLQTQPATNPLAELGLDLVARLGQSWPAGYTSELSLGLAGWVEALSQSLSAGLVLISDYGLSEQEYYRDDRIDGTLLAHRHHRASADALALPGLQDLTAWVDFSRLAAAGTASGMALQGYNHQAGFLMAGGLETLPQPGDVEGQLRQAAELKTLLLPGEMGERFRFMGFSKGCEHVLPGFRSGDLRYTL